MAECEALLKRYQPQLKYDSNEAFFADSAAEWTDSPRNALRRESVDGRPGEILAAASPNQGQQQLSLAFLAAARYQSGAAVQDNDIITNPHRDYREQYVSLRQEPGYANRMYGRCKQGSDGLWLQYWLYYFFNDYNLAGGFGLHEGDWEMVQFRMGEEHPALAVYAQHRWAEFAPWEEVEKLEGNPDTPVVYVARGSHASYFRPGYHETEAWYDIADGKRRTPKLALEIISDDTPSWVGWPGRWGDTLARIPGLEHPSPRGPGAKEQWDEPKTVLKDARRKSDPEKAPAAPKVNARRVDGHLQLEFDFSSHPGLEPERLVVTINSIDDPLPPRTLTFAVQGASRGTIQTRVSLDPTKNYDVAVSATDPAGKPSESNVVLIGPADGRGRGLAAIPATIGRLVTAIRHRLGR